jgi:alkylation response protein AidB-like acyl-CoA dehydrogenase
MDFVFNDEQQMLRDSVDRYGAESWPAEKRLQMLSSLPEQRGRYWAEMAELGWLMLPIAEADGGLGGNAVDVMALMEGIGRHLIALPYVSSCVLVPGLIGETGDAAATLLEQIGGGTAIAAAGLLEEDSGYDLHRVRTAAERTAGGYRLSGEKVQVEDGADADWFVVSARTAGGTDDGDGISLFLVPRDADGLTVERFRSIDGHRHCRLQLNGVDKAILVGTADAALPVIEAAVDRAICANLAEATGSMDVAAAATLDYIRTRQQFGVAIGTFQSIQHRMVDMTVACEEGRAMTYHATLNLHRENERRRAVSGSKTRVGQSGIYVGQQAVQLHGGVGFSDELIVSHHLKRQMMLDLAHGTGDHHRGLFATASAA